MSGPQAPAGAPESPSGGRGRRPGGPDTRGQVLEAARAAFAARGYVGTSVRAVAREAGVDPSLVHHYFGSKDDLFLAALEIPVDPRTVIPTVFAEGTDGAGERLLRVFLSVWDDEATRLPLLALVRTSLGEAGPVSLLREGMFRMVFGPVSAALPAEQAERRAELVATQLIGLVVGRYLLQLEPLASMPTEELVGWVAPNLQRYLDGPLP